MCRPVSRATAFYVLVQISHGIIIMILGPPITTAGKEVESPIVPLKALLIDLTLVTSVHILLSHPYPQESPEVESF